MHADHLGTPKAATDATQGIAWAADYLPYGEAQVTAEAVTLNVRFPGQYFDGETALHYNYFRDYNAALGRYVQDDPIGLAGGINTYAYVMNNPIRHSDPTDSSQTSAGEPAIEPKSAYAVNSVRKSLAVCSKAAVRESVFGAISTKSISTIYQPDSVVLARMRTMRTSHQRVVRIANRPSRLRQ